ncbi:MAG: hypothetical protein WC933_02665 [Candidatus Paceibacterota bacterium]|jgi:hypothetical protein
MAEGAGLAPNKYDFLRPELWTPRVSRFFKSKLYAANFFKDYSSDVMNADVVHIPKFMDTGTNPAGDIATTNGDVTAVSVAQSTTALTVNRWKGAATYITKFEQREIMARPAAIDEYASYLGYKCAQRVEAALLAHISQSGSGLDALTSSVGWSSSAIGSTQVEEAFGILDSNSVPKEECRIFMQPKVYWKDIMSIQKYYDASQFGRATLPFGVHDVLYGVPVTLTNNMAAKNGLTGTYSAIVHPGAVAFAKYGPDFVAKEGEHLRKKLIADVMYGDKILQPTWGVKLISSASL